ncbi:hypothetical protein QBC44DRAFT_203270, partial [Cladorrhinum sp. PSN332]
IRLEEQLDKICKTLVKTDPLANHKDASHLRTEGTCNWLSTSQHWEEWLAAATGKPRLLWLYAVLGGGKTILALFMIEQVNKHVKSKEGTKSEAGTGNLYASCFYYCHYSRNQDESVPFLLWVLNQLCRRARSIPDILKKHYEQDPDVEPSIEQLLAWVEAVLVYFRDGRVYIVVDAVDESKKPWTDLLKVITDLGTEPRFGNLSIAVTSRTEFDIQQKLKSVSVSLDIESFVKEDIRKHVDEKLKNDESFKAWPEELKKEVRNTVSPKAGGMFRYASCQLAILADCGGITEVKKALVCLPVTLDETYDRILANILKRDRQAVIEAFAILMCHHGYWGLDTKSASLLVETIATANHEQNGFFDRHSLVQACGPLISINDQGNIAFAHYTVKEYLASSRLREKTLDPVLTE